MKRTPTRLPEISGSSADREEMDEEAVDVVGVAAGGCQLGETQIELHSRLVHLQAIDAKFR